MSSRVVCSKIRLGCKRHEPRGTVGREGLLSYIQWYKKRMTGLHRSRSSEVTVLQIYHN